MDTTGNTAGSEPPPPRPPTPPTLPPTPPPVPPSSPPPEPPDEQPAPFPPLPRRGEILEISVRRRTLWVGAAAFPLHNLTRVEAFKPKPDRGAAVMRFLKWLAVTVVAFAVIHAVTKGEVGVGADGSPLFLAVLIGLVVVLFKELFEPRKPILAVETAGGSWAVATLPNVDELRAIAGRIVHAIDHPEAEFVAYVHQLNNHYNGPVINQTGSGNTGIRL
ncbi:DUF6232 family protein [Streptomyces sp. NPDC094032]|uniref:DUF6232 family protein n=1 Tax=Streptomyces sp. NPDC094032 TaxID=3155308 RepID=UPI00331B3C18